MDALHGVGERDFHGVSAGMKAETGAMTKIELAKNAIREAGGGHDGVGGVGVDLGEDTAGIDLAGTLGNVYEKFVEIGGGNHGGGVGFELDLKLRDFEGDGLGVVGGSGRQQEGNREQKQ